MSIIECSIHKEPMRMIFVLVSITEFMSPKLSTAFSVDGENGAIELQVMVQVQLVVALLFLTLI